MCGNHFGAERKCYPFLLEKGGGLIQGEDPVVPQDCENVEESQDEERVLNRVIEKMGECDIEDEDNLVELIEIAEEIAEEPPRKKQKQAKMTSFFVKKTE